MGVKTFYIGKSLDDPQRATVIFQGPENVLCNIFMNPETKPIVESSGYIYVSTKITRWISWENKLFMNYQLLIESYSFGTDLSEQEIELLTLELETQIMNINISTEFGCFKSAPSHICKRLDLKTDTYWIMCLAEILDLHLPTKSGKTKSVEVFDLLLEKGLVVG